MEGRSRIAVCGGFAFWLGLAYLYYARDLAGAVVFVLLFAVAAALYGRVRGLRSRRPPRPPLPKSDLPRFKFDNVRPKDFE